MEDFLSTQWESTSIRHAFIRKVRLPIVCFSFFPVQSANDCEYHLKPMKSFFLFSRFCVCGQVYLILAMQLAVTFSVVAVFTFV